MTPELFKNLCRWFLEWGTREGIYAALYMSLTWNLACRGNNTGKIRFSHMSWTAFDCMHINFRHTKTEHHGQAKRRKRAVYSNSFEHYIDVPFLLGLYLATSFGEEQRRGMKLFPGSSNSQKQRAGDLLRRCLKEHEGEVLGMGYDSITDIGLHLIRKGVSTYLASLPGGPSPAALSIRGGWSMGQVKDIYFDHSEGGDEFCGRCACLLNLMSSNFATTPVYFLEKVCQKRLDATIGAVFPHFQKIDGMKRILTNCLASLLFHSAHVVGTDVKKGMESNHAARSIPIFRDISLTEDLEMVVGTEWAWQTHQLLTGVPTYIRSLVDLAELKNRQKKLVGEVVAQVMAGVTKYFDDRRIGGGEMTEARINDIVGGALKEQFGSFENRLKDQMESLSENFAKATGNVVPSMVEKSGKKGKPALTLGTLGGKLTRLPKDFQFPMLGVHDLWMKWNLGDDVRGIPPLGRLTVDDVKFLDKVDKTTTELRGCTGKHKDRRRKSSKTMCDIKFICKLIERTAEEEGMDTTNLNYQNLTRMCELTLKKWDPKASSRLKNQHKWQTVVHRIRSTSRANRKSGNGPTLPKPSQIAQVTQDSDSV